MKRLPFLLAALAVVFACSDSSTTPFEPEDPELVVSYGFEPSPFRLFQINSVARQLGRIDRRLRSVVDPLVEDPEQTPTLFETVRVQFMAEEVAFAGSRITRILDEPPEGELTPEFADAVSQVEGNAGGINKFVEEALAVLGFEPTPFRAGLEAIQTESGEIVQFVGDWQEGPTCSDDPCQPGCCVECVPGAGPPPGQCCCS